ncbi:MAG: hypothetical protein O3C40_31375 [Planctomycetota bacterium]|nr:hypothetical protein [Planctomycetota bacterium]
MPITFQPKTPLHGIAMKSALKDELAEVCTKANYTSEDGTNFLFHIEAIWSFFGPHVKVRPSLVDNFLVILPPEGEMTIYCNELIQRVEIRGKRDFKAGQPVTKDDIAEINEVQFCTADGEMIELPADSGVISIFSHDWRKAVFYDLSPLTGPERTISIGQALGQQLSGMMFQEFYAVKDEQWNRMIEWGWFPFIGLSDADRKQVVAFSTRETEVRDVFKSVCDRYRPTIHVKLESWKKKSTLQGHIPFLESALERLIKDDFITSISTLYPRIEGVMRSLALIENLNVGTSQGKMVDNLVNHKNEYSLLLPDRFKQYLKSFYFRSFNFRKGELPLSRHTQGHGLSRAEDYDLVNATLGFLIFDQLFSAL